MLNKKALTPDSLNSLVIELFGVRKQMYFVRLSEQENDQRTI